MENRIKDLMEKGAREGIFPGAVLLTAQKGGVVFYEAIGFRSLMKEGKPMTKDNIFDLASLTKPFATTLALMKLVDDGRIGLDQPLVELITATVPKEKSHITPRLLLNHSAGFLDWKPFYLELIEHRLEERKKILRERIIEEPLAYSPGTRCLYSDLGFMILEWLIEEGTGESLPEFLQRNFYDPLSFERTFFSETKKLRHGTGYENPSRSPFIKGGREDIPFGMKEAIEDFQRKDNACLQHLKEEFAATEDCPWRKRVLQGEVHDENAYAVGGFSGHAGLFGTAEEVYGLVNLLREHFLGQRNDYFNPETVKGFFKRQDIVDGCTWALGWDTPSPEGSSSGRYFSRKSVGHLGFTGTSVWMDLERDIVVILLTNRVHPTRNNEKIKLFRPMLHDAIIEELGENK